MRVRLGQVIAVLTALAVLFMYRGTLDFIDFFFQDTFMQRESGTDNRVVVIGIDDESIENIGKWPWDRRVHAQLIDTLTQGKPAVIAFDITFPVPSDDPEENKEMIDAVKRAGNVVLARYGTFHSSAKQGSIEAVELSEPFLELKEAATGLGHINTIPDEDQVVRKSLYTFHYKEKPIESFSWIIYKIFERNQKHQVNAEDIPLDTFNRFHIPYAGGPGQFEVVPYSSVLNGEVPPDYFKDRIVLIGPYAVGLKDDYPTPLDHKTKMYGVEIHANIIQVLLEKNFKQELDWKWNAVILVLATLFVYYLFRKVHPGISFIVLVAIISGLIFGSTYLYGKGIIISIGYLISLLITSYIVVIGFNYMKELLERRRVTDIFGRYVAPQVVSQILENGEEGLRLGGTRRELTVLFVDIRGFTPLSEQAEPEEIVEILNEYLDLTATCIFRYGGTLDKFIGDATMAIFNAPLLLEDHQMRAVQAAWAMKEGAVALEKKLMERFGRSVTFGIGIHTGPAVFGNIGSKTRMDYTAIGDTVNTTARLESNAKPGQIIISEAVYESVKEQIMAAPLGEIKVKGKEQGIRIYELEGLT
ncbi:CHASE2 domain-containing protein [Aneurinibacillus sp. REN35]|uniref:CHASE2 domain-containing protein n=1 Tax=Aneurinibacillus sp. REN35 TaxID=3237286 RepID=UPI0035297D9C